MQRLLQRHPAYREEIAAFIESDPIKPWREAIGSSVFDAPAALD
jgi:hypothetical protein